MKYLSFFLLAIPLSAQYCSSSGTFSLSSSTAVVSIYQPPSPVKTATFSTLTITATATTQITFSLEINGTAVAGSTQTVVSVYPYNSTCEERAVSSATTAVGNVIGQYTFGVANNMITIDLSKIIWNPTLPSASGRVITIRSTAATGTISIQWTWNEVKQ